MGVGRSKGAYQNDQDSHALAAPVWCQHPDTPSVEDLGNSSDFETAWTSAVQSTRALLERTDSRHDWHRASRPGEREEACGVVPKSDAVVPCLVGGCRCLDELEDQ